MLCRFVLVPALVAGLWAGPAVARAGDEPAAGDAVAGEAKPDLDGLLKDLDADDLATREEATRALATNTTLTMNELEALLGRPGLSPEQTTRLLTAARDRFVRSPRAALGVQFENPAAGPVVIARTFERFPAAGMLKAGDEIVAVEGRSTTAGWASFRPTIICRDPGDTLRMEIRRGGENIVLDAPLGRYSDLPQGRTLTAEELLRAWEARSAGYASSGGRGGVAVAVEPEPVWQTRGMSAVDMEWHRRFDGESPRAGMMPGGRSTGPLAPVETEGRAALGWNGDPRGANGARVVRVGGAGPERAAPMDAIRVRLSQLITERSQMQAQLTQTRALVGGPGLGDAERRNAQLRVLNLQNQLMVLDQQIDQARAAMVRQAR